MATKSKLCLGAAIICLVVGGLIWGGAIPNKMHPSFNVIFPLGAIFLGLFLVSNLFNKEDEAPEEDQERAMAKTGDMGDSSRADHR